MKKNSQHKNPSSSSPSNQICIFQFVINLITIYTSFLSATIPPFFMGVWNHF